MGVGTGKQGFSPQCRGAFRLASKLLKRRQCLIGLRDGSVAISPKIGRAVCIRELLIVFPFIGMRIDKSSLAPVVLPLVVGIVGHGLCKGRILGVGIGID